MRDQTAIEIVTTSSCSCSAAEKQMQMAAVAEKRHTCWNHHLPGPSAEREPIGEPGLCGGGSETSLCVTLIKPSHLPLGLLPCTLSSSRLTLLHPAVGPVGARLPGRVCPGTAGPGMSPSALAPAHALTVPWARSTLHGATLPQPHALLCLSLSPEQIQLHPRHGLQSLGSDGVSCRRKTSG